MNIEKIPLWTYVEKTTRSVKFKPNIIPLKPLDYLKNFEIFSSKKKKEKH